MRTILKNVPDWEKGNQAAMWSSRPWALPIRLVRTCAQILKRTGTHLRSGPEWSADALVNLQRRYREGKASLLTDDVERLTGRKPITFDQFARDYAFAFQTEAKAAS